MDKSEFIKQLNTDLKLDMDSYMFKQYYHESDGLFSVEMHIPKGIQVGKHRHRYSHLSFLAKGTVNLIVENEIKTLTAPACVNIEANKDHLIEALEDSVWFCTHATDERY